MLRRCLEHPNNFTLCKCIASDCTWCGNYGGTISAVNQCDRAICALHHVGCFHEDCLRAMKAEYRAFVHFEIYQKSWLVRQTGLPLDIANTIHDFMGDLCSPMDIYKEMALRIE